MCLYNKIRKYFDTIEHIYQGQRSASVYQTGITLRKEFGLVGNELESALNEFNRMKCTPPLYPNQVRDIAMSIEESDMHVVEANSDSNEQERKEPNHQIDLEILGHVELPEFRIDKEEAVQRAIAYVKVMPEAISGRNGSAAALKAANKLYEFGIDRETAKRIFTEHYNPRCQPEWSEKEIDRKLDAAYNKPLREAGCMLEAPIQDDVTESSESSQIAEKTPARDALKSKIPKKRVEYHVSTQADAIPVVTLLAKEISVYKDCRTNTPNKESLTIGKTLEAFKKGMKAGDRVEAVRNETDKDKRDGLKRKLPAIVFGSEPQAKRSAQTCIPNGILCLDFDGISVDELVMAKTAIASVPYVFAVGLSASGTGLFALVAYEGTPDLKSLLAAMQSSFNYEIDKSCSDVSRLRFTTRDENLIVKDEVFPAILNERTISTSDAIVTRTQPVEPTSKKAKTDEQPETFIGGCFADVKDEQIHWLWHNRFACGMLNCLHGSPDAGKGYLSFSIASIVSNGGRFPDGTACELGTVLVLGTEEHYGYAKRKLAAQGTNLHNVHYLAGYTDKSGEHSITLVNTDKVREYCESLKASGKPRVLLIIVDPLIQMLGCRSNDNSETQAVLTPVKELAEELDACILFVHHDGKGERDSAAQRALGAQSIMGKMRTGFRVSKHDDGTHSIATSKFNIGMRPKAITFKIERCPNDPEIGLVQYLDTEGDFTADTTTLDKALSRAARWLENFLLAGAVSYKEILEHGDQEGFSKDQLKRAKKEILVESKRVGKIKPHWIWLLPESITGIREQESVEIYLTALEKNSD